MTRRIGFVGYDRLTALDLTGPMEVFQTANALSRLDLIDHGSDRPPPYELITLSPGGEPFQAESGLRLLADVALEAAPELDTVIVPGGWGLRLGEEAGAISLWLRDRAEQIRRVCSVCTGIYALAAAGLLDGRSATTHWAYAQDLARRYPAIRVSPDAIFINDGRFWTSAGVTAGMDLAMALVEQDLGAEAALVIARHLVVYLKREGGQLQYSEPLRFQTRATDRFAALAGWMAANLNADLSVEALAARACLGPRHFSRRFKAVFEATPADYVEVLRLEEARRRLPAANQTVDSVAASVGYRSADAFRRAFERRFGLAPSLYRRRFGAEQAA